MLLRRITEHVKAQNWFAVGIDFVIVVVGVFIGIQVANWNDQRAARSETNRTLELLSIVVEDFEEIADHFKGYYATTKAYGETALEGWADENAISDSAFLVSAYQASQIMGSSQELQVFAELMGAENIRNLNDSELQRLLQVYISSPSNITRSDAVDTPYRRNVRRAIPFTIQEEIRAKCGDQRVETLRPVALPSNCDIELPVEIARSAATDLRARTDLRDDLQWHMASTQSVLADLENELARNELLIAAIRAHLE